MPNSVIVRSSPIPPGRRTIKEAVCCENEGTTDLTSGRYAWSVSPVPGLRILGLDTTIEGHDNGEIPQTELKWIKEEDC